MSRRQALGLLTNQNVQQRTTQFKNDQTFNKQQQQQTVASSNNENNVQAYKYKSQNLEFEIYRDDLNNEKENDVFIYSDKNESKSLNVIDKESPMILDDTLNNKCNQQTTKLEDLIEDDLDEEEDDVRRREAEERDRILMSCEDYAENIIEHLKQLELVNRPKASYLKQQQDITSTMRSILVDWLVEVSEEYKLHTETLYLAVNYTDRFLSKMSVLRGKLQLLGTASMYIASKYEEIFPPDAAEFVYITDDTYTKQQVLRMEHLVLKVLNFHMNAPTANCFLLHFLRYTNAEQKVENLSRYLAELTLVEAEPFLEYVPSQIASAALYLAMRTLDKTWSIEVEKVLGYTLDELKPCIRDLHKCWSQALEHPQQAIQEKYKQERLNYVALIETPELWSLDI